MNRSTTIETRGTLHLKANDFVDRFAEAAPGTAILYAIGDVGFSAPFGAELARLKRLAQERSEAGLACLTQRVNADLRFEPVGGRSFHYIATKRAVKEASSGK